MDWKRLADRLSDGVGNLIGAALIGAAAVYPVVLAIQSGVWWVVLLVCLVIGGGALAMANAARD